MSPKSVNFWPATRFYWSQLPVTWIIVLASRNPAIIIILSTPLSAKHAENALNTRMTETWATFSSMVSGQSPCVWAWASHTPALSVPTAPLRRRLLRYINEPFLYLYTNSKNPEVTIIIMIIIIIILIR